MREIEFRGKTAKGEWLNGYYAKFRNYKNEVYSAIIPKEEGTGEAYMEDLHSVIPETVGQYTGLTDKNGKKIFEGDIVRFTDKYTGGKGIAEIVFEAFKWKYSGSYYGGNPIVWLCIDDLSVKFEVIGNIHDNPELLEEKK